MAATLPIKPRKLRRSYIHVPKTTPFSGKTIGQMFNETANENPDKEMYVFYAEKERKTFRQVQKEVTFTLLSRLKILFLINSLLRYTAFRTGFLIG